jgi:hypothetical protein
MINSFQAGIIDYQVCKYYRKYQGIVKPDGLGVTDGPFRPILVRMIFFALTRPGLFEKELANVD